MRLFNSKKIPLSLMLFSILFFSCSETIEDTAETEVLLESSEQNARAACDSCSGAKPSDLFSLIRHFNIEVTGAIDTNSIGQCNVNYFTNCKGYMVLTSNGNNSARAELKQTTCESINNTSSMSFSMILENIPEYNSLDKADRKGVTIGQIHNRGDKVGRPLLRVYAVNPSNSVRNSSTRKGQIRVAFSTDYRKDLDDTTTDEQLVDFEPGEKIHIKLEILNSGNKVRVFAKNDSRTSLTRTREYTIKSSNNFREYPNTYFYKTGVYQQIAGPQPRASYYYFTTNSLNRNGC